MLRRSLLASASALIVFCAGPVSATSRTGGIQRDPQGVCARPATRRRTGPARRHVADPAIVGYLERIVSRMAGAAGEKPFKIRITRGADRYAYLMPHGVLYISGALLERVETEAELAGLFAHQLAHVHAPPAPAQGSGGNPAWTWPECILASQLAPVKWAEDRRESERLATESAVQTLRAAGYDPTAVLDVLSRLAYENPAWGKAIVADDLLDLRVTLDADIPPKTGYLVDSSAFALEHIRVLQALK